ncbi:VanW family protein [Candidatus Roizmanbacteria bacterium]|nr:VanW family protein [Candidatus Roizmanbacteria bacterium]
MVTTILTILTAGLLIFSGPATSHSQPLSQVKYSLSNRYADTFVNDVFSDNILLTLAYMGGKVKTGNNISWDEVKKTDSTTLLLHPGQTFAFHDNVSEKYKGKIALTTNAHFSSDDGFKSDGWLVGDGVCHLASFMYVAALAAGLETEAPTPHDFAAIEDVPRQYGVSIFYSPNDPSGSALQNLYITNNKTKTIAFVFTYEENSLNIQVKELN